MLVILIDLPVPMRTYVHSHVHNAKKTDYFTVLPLISFCICILLFFVYGFTWSILIATVITLIILFSNITRFYRFCSHLNKEPFSTPFVSFSIFQTILLLGFFVVLCVFFPSFVNSKISKTITFSGSQKSGYEKKSSSPSVTAAKLVVYSGAHNDFGFGKKDSTTAENKADESGVSKNESEQLAQLEQTEESEQIVQASHIEQNEQAENTEQIELEGEQSPVVLFISDIFVDESDSIGTLSYLAEKGYDVYALSFYDRKLSYFEDWRDFYVIFKSFARYENKLKPDNLNKKYDTITRFNYDKYKAALEIMTNLGVENFYILADGFCISAANQIMTENPDKILSVYNINHDNEIAGYVDGHGNLSATRPLEWILLGYTMNRKWDNAKRIAYYADKKFSPLVNEN